MPSSGPSAAARSSPLTSSTVVDRSTSKTQSVSDALSSGHPHGEAVEPALELGEDQADRGRRAGRGRDQRQARRAGAAQVLVRRVDDRLGVRQVVQRRDRPVADADALVDDLDDRRQAVRGAGRRGDDVVPRRVVAVVVDADDDVQRAVVLDGRGDDDLAHAALEVRLERLGRAEPPGALEHDVDAGRVPGHVARSRLAGLAQRGAVDGEVVPLGAHVAVPAPVHRVEREQVRRGRGVAVQLVDVDEVEVAPVPRPRGAPAVPCGRSR